MKTAACNKCGKTWVFTPPMGRKDECPDCGWDSHVCLNCLHYDKNAYHECREPQAEYVQHKDRSNFCDYFEANSKSSKGGGEADTAKDKLEQLFSNQGQKIDDKDGDQPKSLHDELQDFLKKR